MFLVAAKTMTHDFVMLMSDLDRSTVLLAAHRDLKQSTIMKSTSGIQPLS
jgi:hypothetical protein